MRLDRFLSQAAGLSRSRARQAIRRGEVDLGAVTVRDPAAPVDTNQPVRWRGEALHLPAPVYLMLHKPAGYVCSHDEAAHPSIYTLLAGYRPELLHVAGRLDADTTGLVLITDDGEWSHRVTSPRHHYTKSYRVEVAEPLSEAMLEALREGVLLRGEPRPTLPAQVQRLAERSLRLGIEEGRYHQVKRMLAAVGNRVVALHRERIGGLSLDPALEPGQSRNLTVEEVAALDGSTA